MKYEMMELHIKTDLVSEGVFHLSLFMTLEFYPLVHVKRNDSIPESGFNGVKNKQNYQLI